MLIMKKFRSIVTVLFLLTALITILLIAIFDNILIFRAADLIKNYIWFAVIALLIFLGFLFTGIVSTLTKSEGSLIGNGYFQLAILELFLVAAGLAYFRYHIQLPGQIVLRLEPEKSKEYITLGIKFQANGTTTVDTVTAPGELNNRRAGKYSFETLDQDIIYFQTDIVLEPTETETLFVPVAFNFKTLAVQTEPPGAEIWIDGIQAAQTPHTFEILNRDTVILELKMKGYQDQIDTLNLKESLDLGVIQLVKLYSLRISCQYQDVAYRIYDLDGRMVYTAHGSRSLQLAGGKYRIAYEIGEGQFESKSFVLNNNFSLAVP